MIKNTKQAICIALDVDNADTAYWLVDRLKDHVGYFKVGMQLFYHYGPALIDKLIEKEIRIFLDLKFHDIPNTVKNAAISALRMNVNMFNVHASGGHSMMQQAVEGAQEVSQKNNIPMPKILGVTILTSLTQKMVSQELNWPGSLKERVCNLARLSQQAGLDGVVASPREIEWIRNVCGDNFMIVTPGIRPVWAMTQDQKRVMTPSQAMDSGADMIVVGRPVIQAEDPVLAVNRLFD